MNKTIKIIFLFFLLPVLMSAQVSISYFSNGNKRSEGTLKDSVKLGVWKTWFDNKHLADSGEYVLFTADKIRFEIEEGGYTVDTHAIVQGWANKTSIETGKWVYYYDNGKVMQTGSYIPFCLQKISFAQVMDANDNFTIVYSLPMGPTALKTGLWKHFTEEGKLEMEEKYDDKGNLLETKNY